MHLLSDFWLKETGSSLSCGCCDNKTTKLSSWCRSDNDALNGSTSFPITSVLQCHPWGSWVLLSEFSQWFWELLILLITPFLLSILTRDVLVYFLSPRVINRRSYQSISYKTNRQPQVLVSAKILWSIELTGQSQLQNTCLLWSSFCAELFHVCYQFSSKQP